MFAAFITSLLIAYFTAHFLRRFCLKYKIALPPLRARDVHTTPTPRLGGLAIFLGFWLTTLLWHVLKPESFSSFDFPFALFGFSIDKRLLGIILGSLVIVTAMAVDDIKGLKPAQKLFWQILASLIVIASGVGIDYITLPFLGNVPLDGLQIPITLGSTTYHFSVFADLFLLFWLLLLMNSVNFLDGLDGLATGLSWVAALTIVLLSLKPIVNQPATALLALILFGAISGFVPLNWHKAKMFLGDSGSMFLGFILGVLSTISGGKVATLGLVLGLPILDALVVVARRILKGENPFSTADQTHLHHRLIKAGLAVPQAVLFYVALSALIAAISLASSTMAKAGLAATLMGGLCVLLILLKPKMER